MIGRDTSSSAHGHHSHRRQINGEKQLSDGSSLCRIAIDNIMMMNELKLITSVPFTHRAMDQS